MPEPLPHLVQIAPLLPYAQNARTHSADQIEQIKASIRQFGFVGVLGYDEKGLAIGHGRRLALLGMWEAGETVMGPGKRESLPEGMAPAIDISGLSDEERRALILADNKLALNAGWDDEKLAAELRALGELNFAMPVIGFDDAELAKLMRAGREARDPEEVPEAPAAAVTRPGDVWIMGKHRLICGDSTDAETVAAVTAGKKADLTLTDPPYGIGYSYRDHDDSDSDANAKLVEAVFEHASAAKVWTPGLMNLARDLTRFGAARVLVWHKGFAAAGNGLGGASTWEPVLVIEPKVKALGNDYLDFQTDREKLGEKMLREYHPCPKPVALFTHLATAFTKAGGSIYEPFSGSGTTIMACEASGRRCRAVEIDPVYVDVAIMRWQGSTDGEAKLEATGQSFEAVKAERLAATA